MLNFKGRNILLLTWALWNSKGDQGKTKSDGSFNFCFPKESLWFLVWSSPSPSGGTQCHYIHLLRQRSRVGYLAVVSHQATGRVDCHTESLRMNLLLALWVTRHPPPSTPSLNPESYSKMFSLLFDLPSEFILEECTKILWILQECWTQWKVMWLRKQIICWKMFIGSG